MQQFLELPAYADEADRMDISRRLMLARRQLDQVQSAVYLESLVGTIGADPLKPAREVRGEASFHERRVA